MEDFYSGVWGIVFIFAFIIGYGYAIAQYGYLIGVGLGWIPALITALIAATLWPLVILVILTIIAVVVFA